MNNSSVLHSFLWTFVILLFLTQRAIGLVNESVLGSRIAGSFIPLKAAPNAEVEVWDNVIDEEHLAPILHEESRRIGLGHNVFSRSSSLISSKSSKNIIEQTLDSILTELNDDSNYVEYWTRLEWRSIHAHADVDEYRAKKEQQSNERNDNSFQYPRNGHVLYLQVGSNVRGPTCVFPNRRSGGDLLRKIDQEPMSSESKASCSGDYPDNGDLNDENELDEISREAKHDNNVELFTVPAVPGRLLRFQGDFLHAVPRPTDLWLLKFVKGSPTFEPEEEWGRSVILFNTWSDHPPLGLPVDEMSSAATCSSGDGDSRRNCINCNQMHEWSRATALSPGDSDTAKEQLSAKIWLLGDYRRRDHKMQTVKLEATESLREALYQESNVMTTKLTIPS